MKLHAHLSHEPGLADLLNYAHVIDEGVLINKDGALLISYKFHGPDLYSSSSGELDALTANFNRMATLLEDGWMLHVDELRVPALSYPAQGAFPDDVSWLIDEERRQRYETIGAHYENFQFISFVWKFPRPVVRTLRHWFVDGMSRDEDQQNLSTLLKQFYEVVERCIGLLSTSFVLEKLSSADLLSYLNTCISGELLPVAVPKDGCFIDVVLGRRNCVGGYSPQIGNRHMVVLSIMGYLNEDTMPGLLEEMGTYPLVYRWSNRFIPLSQATAEREIKRYQRNWHNKVKGFTGILKEVISGTPSQKVDYAALQMHQQTDEALTINTHGSTRFGYWTSEIVLIHEDHSLLAQAAKDLSRYIEQAGFACIQEDVNAMDAWLGTIPGHGSCNIRRVFIHSMNLAHVLPLHTLWAGRAVSAPSSLLPPQSPPVFYAATTGKTPFRFHMDVADVGHQVILGPTGSGKSTYLGFLIAQFLRYPNAQIFVFDKDHSHHALTAALEGHHYDIGHSAELAFCPLADLSSTSQKTRAAQFIEDLVALQNIAITPEIRAAIFAAIESLAQGVQGANRNLTVFRAMVQHEDVRAALHYYTLDGQFPLLDATADAMKSGYLHTFEMNWLLAQKPEIYIPVLRYIFDHIESCLEAAQGRQPTLIILEEAWAYLAHPVFAQKLKEWLKTLRKKNARVVFATQSLADLYDPSTQSLTATTAAIMESCPTKVYLPNSFMDAEMTELYRKMGLSDRQLDIIKQIAIPKRDYYVVTPEGNRLIDLGLQDASSLPLAFIGLSLSQGHALIECKKKYQHTWLYEWLMQQGLEHWAKSWQNHRSGGGEP